MVIDTDYLKYISEDINEFGFTEGTKNLLMFPHRVTELDLEIILEVTKNDCLDLRLHLYGKYRKSMNL